MSLRSRFIRTFADLPIPERDKVAAVIDGIPMTWNVLRIEIENETEIGLKALEFLEKYELIKKDE